jgi:hypothetical protein
MTRTKGDNLQGALALLVLKSLEPGPMPIICSSFH